MPEHEVLKNTEMSDMPVAQFADLNERGLVILLGSDAASKHVAYIRAQSTNEATGRELISSYLLTAAVAREFDIGALKAIVYGILESEQKTA